MKAEKQNLEMDVRLAHESLKKKGISLVALSSSLGVSRQTVHHWFAQRQVPPRYALKFRSLVGLPAERLFPRREELSISFRTDRNRTPSDEARERLIDAARTYLAITQDLASATGGELRRDPARRNPLEVAAFLRRELELNGAVTADALIRSLTRHGIHVLFVPFSDQHEQGALVEDGQRKIIFTDTKERLEDLPWRIAHELAHLAMDREEPGGTKTVELFCNAVANEMMAPRAFLARYGAKLKEADCKPRLVQILEWLSEQTGATFLGIVLSLRESRLISPSQAKYLHKVAQGRRGRRQVGEELCCPAEQDPAEFFERLFQDLTRDHLCLFQRQVALAAAAGTMSSGRAAELLGIDPLSARDLVARLSRNLDPQDGR